MSGYTREARRLPVAWKGAERAVSLEETPATGAPLPVCMVLAHGAGGSRSSPFMTQLADALAAAGVATIRFNFPYSEAGRRMPDPQALLLATWNAVAADVRSCLPAGTALVAGGKSMGGRMAGLAAAAGLPVDGLVYFGFPLHPPRRGGIAGGARIAPLMELPVPQLFVQGSRDRFGGGEVLRPHLEGMTRVRLVEVPGADHSLERPRRDGVPLQATLADVARGVAAWLREEVLPSQRGLRAHALSVRSRAGS